MILLIVINGNNENYFPYLIMRHIAIVAVFIDMSVEISISCNRGVFIFLNSMLLLCSLVIHGCEKISEINCGEIWKTCFRPAMQQECSKDQNITL